MAKNLAADLFKTAFGSTPPLAAAGFRPDSAVAERDATGSETSDTATQTDKDHGQPALPTLSDEDLSALKNAYLQVKDALAEAQEQDSSTTGTATDTAADEDASAGMPSRHPADPLAALLAEATGDEVGDVQAVLRQVQDVVRQEHGADHAEQAADEAATEESAATDQPVQEASLWHDQRGHWFGGAPSAGQGGHPGNAAGGYWYDQASPPADAGQGTAEGATGDGQDLLFGHHIAHLPASVAQDADVVSAVDQFTGVIQSLDLVSTHGHPADAAHTDSAA